MRSRRRLVLLILALVAAGCGGGGPGGAPTTPTPTQAAPATTPTPDLRCRLPVRVGNAPAPWGQGAWLDLGTGSLTPDPGGDVTVDEKTRLITTTANPVLRGNSGIFYSLAAGRWLPANRASISPDGLSYAYTEFWSVGVRPTKLHIVDVRTAQDSAFTLEGDPGVSVLEYASDAVFLTFAWEGRVGVWRFDLRTHTLEKLSDHPNVFAVDRNSVWIGTANRDDPHPVESVMGGDIPNQVDRIDLSTGETQTWLYRPGAAITVAMIDAAGHPVASVDPGMETATGFYPGDEGELVVVDRPGDAVTLWSDRSLSAPSPGAVDEHGMWFGGSTGIYVLAPESGRLEQVSTVDARPAGGCH